MPFGHGFRVSDTHDEAPGGVSGVATTPGGVASGLTFWFRTDEGISTTGSDVDSWTDKVAGITMVDVNPPTLVSADINGHDTVLFDATNERLIESSTQVLDGTETGATLFMVASTTSGATSTSYVFGVADLAMEFRFQPNDGTNPMSSFVSVIPAFNQSNDLNGFDSNANSPFIITGLLDLTLGSLEHKVAANGDSFDEITLAGNTLPSSNGAEMGVASGTITGSVSVAEMIFYNRALTTQEVSDVRTYLSTRYSITL